MQKKIITFFCFIICTQGIQSKNEEAIAAVGILYGIGYVLLDKSCEKTIIRACDAAVPLTTIALNKYLAQTKSSKEKLMYQKTLGEVSNDKIIDLLAAELNFDSPACTSQCIKLLHDLAKCKRILTLEEASAYDRYRLGIDQIIVQALFENKSLGKPIEISPETRKKLSLELLDALKRIQRRKYQFRLWKWSPLWLPVVGAGIFFLSTGQ